MNSATPRQQLLEAIEALSDRQITLLLQFIRVLTPRSTPQPTDASADPLSDFIGATVHGNLAASIDEALYD